MTIREYEAAVKAGRTLRNCSACMWESPEADLLCLPPDLATVDFTRGEYVSVSRDLNVNGNCPHYKWDGDSPEIISAVDTGAMLGPLEEMEEAKAKAEAKEGQE